MIGDSPVFRDTRDNFTTKRTAFRGTGVLWVLLMRKNVNTEFMNKNDLNTFKNY